MPYSRKVGVELFDFEPGFILPDKVFNSLNISNAAHNH